MGLSSVRELLAFVDLLKNYFLITKSHLLDQKCVYTHIYICLCLYIKVDFFFFLVFFFCWFGDLLLLLIYLFLWFENFQFPGFLQLQTAGVRQPDAHCYFVDRTVVWWAGTWRESPPLVSLSCTEICIEHSKLVVCVCIIRMYLSTFSCSTVLYSCQMQWDPIKCRLSWHSCFQSFFKCL